MNKMTFKLQNMKCAGCTERILKKVLEVPGVLDVHPDLEQEELTFSYSSFNSPEMVKNVLKRLGYPLRDEANSIKDQVQSYVSCMLGRAKI